MPFTDRFIKVPTKVYNGKQSQMGLDEGDCEKIVTWTKINPFDIASYSEAIESSAPFEESSKIITTVLFKGGVELSVYLTMKEFEKLLNEHQNS